jgi:hypothetical protein
MEDCAVLVAAGNEKRGMCENSYIDDPGGLPDRLISGQGIVSKFGSLPFLSCTLL